MRRSIRQNGDSPSGLKSGISGIGWSGADWSAQCQQRSGDGLRVRYRLSSRRTKVSSGSPKVWLPSATFAHFIGRTRADTAIFCPHCPSSIMFVPRGFPTTDMPHHLANAFTLERTVHNPFAICVTDHSPDQSRY